jgi:hypothetical protein
MLSKLKAWFSSLFKIEVKSANEWLDLPDYEPPAEYQGVDLRFYTNNYKISNDEKKALVAMVQRPEFRTFEKYLDWRVNAAAHRMKSLLLEGNSAAARDEASAIEALVKITQDMQNFWQEIKLLDLEEGLVMDGKKKDTLRPFGVDKISIQQ